MRLGVKVHWRDVDAMAALAERHGARVLEYQMLPGDLERHSQDAFDALLPYRGRFELRVHQPEAYLHEGEPRFLDPSARDEEERARSAAFLGEVARHAMELRAKALVVHPGGVSARDGDPGRPRALAEALEDVPRHVPLLLENMPRAYGGLRKGYSPTFARDADGLAPFADVVDGFVLDISHAWLSRDPAAPDAPLALARTLGPRVRHVHASGARGGRGTAGEGTPFSDSDYGVGLVRDVLRHLPPDVVVVPEVMDGHRDGGRAFDEALAALAGGV